MFLNVFQLSDIRNTPTVLYFDFKEFLIFVFVILFSHICLFCICALVHDRDYLCLFGLLPFLPRPTGHPVEIYKEISGHNFISSVRSSNSHPDLLVIQHPTHFFRSHRSSTLDFHFLSHYSYIKAIMLYKGKTRQDSGILWNTLAGILWHTLAYIGILWHTLAYSGIL